ncbi:MAG: hypothetical protein MI976_00880 [Pseudomonadales bacterium]|nr:hypothetical protein [Pseudomonadales bacterium]
MSIAFTPNTTGISNDFVTRIRNTLSGNWALINIFQKSGQPELEKHILNEGASYGRQLGILIEMVEYLRDTTDSIDPDAAPVKAFDRLNTDIKLAKLKFQQQPKENDIYTQLENIARQDPQQLARLKQYIEELVSIAKTNG